MPEPDAPDALMPPDDPELPDALCPDPRCPSPCDELPRSRLELADEPLMPPDEPEVFWSRSAMMKSSR